MDKLLDRLRRHHPTSPKLTRDQIVARIAYLDDLLNRLQTVVVIIKPDLRQ